MADWQEAVQASVIALVFALMVAKLVSVVISFRGENLRVEREAPGKDDLYSDFEDVAVEDTSSSSESGNWDEDQKFEEEVLAGAEKMVEVEEKDLPLHVEVLDEVHRFGDADVGLHPLSDERSKKNPVSSVEDEKPAADSLNESNLDVNDEREEQITEALGELSDSDGWEGVESSELDERFNAAATFVAARAVGPGLKVSNDTQLLLYALYKIATEGPCSSPQPLAYKMSARAKWNSWQKLGNMGSEEAMDRYIAVVSEIIPNWAQGTNKIDEQAQAIAEGDASQRSGMGPVFSSLVMNEEGVGEGILENIHMHARDGDQEGLQQEIEEGTSVDLKEVFEAGGVGECFYTIDVGLLYNLDINIVTLYRNCAVPPIDSYSGTFALGDITAALQQIHATLVLNDWREVCFLNVSDSDGRTALHWAADRGHLHAVELLLSKGAQINTKDSEGQTALHYATTCEREEIAKYLVKEGAEPFIVDNDGVSPLSSRPGRWFWMGGTT